MSFLDKIMNMTPIAHGVPNSPKDFASILVRSTPPVALFNASRGGANLLSPLVARPNGPRTIAPPQRSSVLSGIPGIAELMGDKIPPPIQGPRGTIANPPAGPLGAGPTSPSTSTSAPSPAPGKTFEPTQVGPVPDSLNKIQEYAAYYMVIKKLKSEDFTKPFASGKGTEILDQTTDIVIETLRKSGYEMTPEYAKQFKEAANPASREWVLARKANGQSRDAASYYVMLTEMAMAGMSDTAPASSTPTGSAGLTNTPEPATTSTDNTNTNTDTSNQDQGKVEDQLKKLFEEAGLGGVDPEVMAIAYSQWAQRQNTIAGRLDTDTSIEEFVRQMKLASPQNQGGGTSP